MRKESLHKPFTCWLRIPIMTRKPEEIVELYLSGLSTRQISEKLGIGKTTIAKYCKGLRSQTEAAVLRQPAKSTHWRTTRQVARNLWKRIIGPIPKGCHIHHKDGNHTNNTLTNLECIDGRLHNSLHSRGLEYNIPRHLRSNRKRYMRQYLAEYRKNHVNKT